MQLSEILHIIHTKYIKGLKVSIADISSYMLDLLYRKKQELFPAFYNNLIKYIIHNHIPM